MVRLQSRGATAGEKTAIFHQPEILCILLVDLPLLLVYQKCVKLILRGTIACNKRSAHPALPQGDLATVQGFEGRHHCTPCRVVAEFVLAKVNDAILFNRRRGSARAFM